MLDPHAGQIRARPQNIDERIVEIKGSKIRPGREQCGGERPGPGANLENAVAGSVNSQPRDTRRRAHIHKKVLPKRLLRPQPASAQ